MYKIGDVVIIEGYVGVIVNIFHNRCQILSAICGATLIDKDFSEIKPTTRKYTSAIRLMDELNSCKYEDEMDTYEDAYN